MTNASVTTGYLTFGSQSPLMSKSLLLSWISKDVYSVDILLGKEVRGKSKQAFSV
jgi:hypothetical protein